MELQDRERIFKLEIQMRTALEGVGNFRAFQNRATDFFTRHEERELAWQANEKKKKEADEKKDKKRAMIHYWWLGLLSALIVAGFTVILTQFFALKSEHHISDAPQSTSQNLPQLAQ